MMSKIDTFFQAHPIRTYRKNTILIDANQGPSGLYYIVSGTVKVTIDTRDGNERLLINLGPTEMLPLAAFFMSEPQPFTYTAMTDVRAIWRPAEEVNALFAKEPETLKEIIAMLLRGFYSRVRILSHYESGQRIIAHLLGLSYHLVASREKEVTIETTHRELAAAVGLSRESTSTILKRLETLGIVVLKRNRIHLNLDKAREALYSTDDTSNS